MYQTSFNILVHLGPILFIFLFTFPSVLFNLTPALIQPQSISFLIFSASAFILPSGYTLNVSGVTTGGTVSYSGSQGSGSYTLVRRGDINADNSTNRTDYNIVKNTLSGPRDLTAGSASEAAGDMNSDGVVDAFDAALLDLYLNDVPVY